MKNCETCKHQELKHNEVPCVECSALYEKWTDKESKMNCEDCKHISVDEDAEPCKSCLSYPNWEKEEEVIMPIEKEKDFIKSCSNCISSDRHPSMYPYSTCRSLSNWITFKDCESCKFRDKSPYSGPCSEYHRHSKWVEAVVEPDGTKNCYNCKFLALASDEDPCNNCIEKSNWRSENHMRFQDAQVGDKVYSKLHGSGEITLISNSDSIIYPLTIKFEKGQTPKVFTVEGKIGLHNEEAILYYETSDNKYSEIRPEPTLDWSKVPVNTKVNYQSPRYIVRKGHYKSPGFVFADGEASWSKFISGFNHVKCDIIELAEEVTLDGKTYPVGTRWTAPK